MQSSESAVGTSMVMPLTSGTGICLCHWSMASSVMLLNIN